MITPWLIAVVLGTGLLALVPTRRLAERVADRWAVALYFIVLWLALALAVGGGGARRFAIPIAIVLAIAPWVTFRAGMARLLGRQPRERRPPPRNVTPPDG